jgi:hypothetical protein
MPFRVMIANSASQARAPRRPMKVPVGVGLQVDELIDIA